MNAPSIPILQNIIGCGAVRQKTTRSMEPTFTIGQVVFYLNPSRKQYFPAIITEVKYMTDNIEYKLEVQSGTGHALRSEETTVAQDGILTFKEFTEAMLNQGPSRLS